MEIFEFRSDLIKKETISEIIEKSFEGSGDADIENWFSFEEMLNNIHSGRGAFLFALEDNKISAIIYAQTESPINGREGKEKWIINLLAVLPENRRRGIGKKMVASIEEIAKGKEVVKIFVSTNESDQSARNFYFSLGFKLSGRLEEYQYGQNNPALFLYKYL